jgi:hypothetical protein
VPARNASPESGVAPGGEREQEPEQEPLGERPRVRRGREEVAVDLRLDPLREPRHGPAGGRRPEAREARVGEQREELGRGEDPARERARGVLELLREQVEDQLDIGAGVGEPGRERDGGRGGGPRGRERLELAPQRLEALARERPPVARGDGRAGELGADRREPLRALARHEREREPAAGEGLLRLPERGVDLAAAVGGQEQALAARAAREVGRRPGPMPHRLDDDGRGLRRGWAEQGGPVARLVAGGLGQRERDWALAAAVAAAAALEPEPLGDGEAASSGAGARAHRRGPAAVTARPSAARTAAMSG